MSDKVGPDRMQFTETVLYKVKKDFSVLGVSTTNLYDYKDTYQGW